jgi:hypothetical protein
MKLRWIGALGAAGTLVWAQAGSVAGPSAGYVFDQGSQVLRQVRGIPGAALLSDAIDTGMSLTAATVAPRGDTAIGIAADGSVHLLRLNGGAGTERALANLMASPAGVVFSPSGTAAALYRPGSVQVLKGLPDAPAVGITVALPSTAMMRSVATTDRLTSPGARSAQETIAISDDAAYLLLGRAEEVDLVTVAGGVGKLMDAPAGALVAFAAGGHDAAIASGGTVRVYQDVAGAATRRDFPGAGGSVGLAFTADGGRVLVAGLRSVALLDRVSGDSKSVALDFRPTSLSAMSGLFRLNDAGAWPMWLLDGTAAEPKLYFVPARTGL